jgi:hypothetical protein
MPRPNPLEAWDELLRDAVSSDEDEQENALFLIGLILERHHKPNSDAPDLYESHLSRELLRLVLADNRQQAAVIYLAKLPGLMRHPARCMRCAAPNPPFSSSRCWNCWPDMANRSTPMRRMKHARH